jgi:hypothetical protein
MIKERNEHWNREEGLERDVIGLQFYIDHTQHGNSGNAAHRQSSLSTKSDNEHPTINEPNVHVANDEEAGEIVHQSGRLRGRRLSAISSFTTNRSEAASSVRHSIAQKAASTFFDHFLDGSAGVMYTSFVGLIIDEIVNFGSQKYKAGS